VNELVGRVALVTGAAAGIGLGVARRLANEGASVAMVDRNAAELAEAAAELERSIGARVQPIVADVSSVTDVEAAVETAAKTLGPIDVLVNNAGVWVIKTYLEHTDDDIERLWSVNLRGAHLFMSRVLPSMIKRGRGSIINISSVAAQHYTAPHAGYAATKAGVEALTRDVAFEVAGYGVRINAIAPGMISPKPPEDVVKSKAAPLGRGGPDDIAGVVAFLASEDARFIIGHTIPVCGGTDIWVSLGFDSSVADAGRARQAGE